jgi:uncharacterized protein (TIGR01777 family)
MPKILITGASGLIGTRIQEMLLAQRHDIHTLGRSAGVPQTSKVSHFIWDVKNQKIDSKALAGVDTIIHLAGAGVADERWTSSRKKEIMDSRVDATKVLYKTLASTSHQVKTIISASAVGYYGDCGDETVIEDHPVADTFLAEVTSRWEEEVSKMEKLGIRHVCCRIGIVLAKNGGALPELVKTFPIGIAGYFAKSPLYYPWIHIDDVCGIMIHARQNQTMRGSYNTTAPGPVPIKTLMEAILAAKKSKAILAPVPTFALKLALGEMADMLLSSQRCSDDKIIKTGYEFHFPSLAKALADIYPEHD